MNTKDTLVIVGGLMNLWIIIVGLIAIACLLLLGLPWAIQTLLPWFTVLTWVAFGIVVFICLPLAIPKVTRGISSVTLFVASYVFGATLWMAGLLLTYASWGVVAVIIGLCIGGLGVVPIAMLATLINGMWLPFISLVLLTILTFVAWSGALSLAESLER